MENEKGPVVVEEDDDYAKFVLAESPPIAHSHHETSWAPPIDHHQLVVVDLHIRPPPIHVWRGGGVHIHENKHGEVVVGQNAEKEAAMGEVAVPADDPMKVGVAVGQVEEQKPVRN